jgi:hypothetical protein
LAIVKGLSSVFNTPQKTPLEGGIRARRDMATWMDLFNQKKKGNPHAEGHGIRPTTLSSVAIWGIRARRDIA